MSDATEMTVRNPEFLDNVPDVLDIRTLEGAGFDAGAKTKTIVLKDDDGAYIFSHSSKDEVEKYCDKLAAEQLDEAGQATHKTKAIFRPVPVKRDPDDRKKVLEYAVGRRYYELKLNGVNVASHAKSMNRTAKAQNDLFGSKDSALVKGLLDRADGMLKIIASAQAAQMAVEPGVEFITPTGQVVNNKGFFKRS